MPDLDRRRRGQAATSSSGPATPRTAWVQAFQDETGCVVTSRVAATSDEMVQLMHTGQYDGVSAWGDAATRLVLAARRGAR